MKRTAEKVLAIIGLVLTSIGVIFGFIVKSIYNIFITDPTMYSSFEAEMYATDPSLTPDDIEIMHAALNFFGGIIWVLIAGLIISLILIIIGLVNITKNDKPKIAGTMFIIAGVVGGLLSIPSILLYVAGILCFTRKPPVDDNFIDDQYDGSMRPL